MLYYVVLGSQKIIYFKSESTTEVLNGIYNYIIIILLKLFNL